MASERSELQHCNRKESKQSLDDFNNQVGIKRTFKDAFEGEIDDLEEKKQIQIEDHPKPKKR